jgi:hypothetical protein
MKFKDAQTNAVAMFSSPEFIERVRDEDDTMLRHLDILARINAAGFLTTNSQAGRKSKGAQYEIQERAYLFGFMLEKDAVQFIKSIGISTDKNAVFVPFCSDDIYLPSALDVPVTISKKDGQIRIETHISMALPNSVWQSFRKQVKLNKGEPVVFITCWDTKWNRNASGPSGLFTDVLKVLNSLK